MSKTSSKNNKSEIEKELTNPEKIQIAMEAHKMQFEIKRDIDQKINFILTAIGIYSSILILNIFSIDVFSLNDRNITKSLEFINDIYLDINFLVSFIIFILFWFILRKNLTLNTNKIIENFPIFIGILYYISLPFLLLTYNKNHQYILDINFKYIFFLLVISFLLCSIFYLFKITVYSKYYILHYIREQSDIVKYYTYNDVIDDLFKTIEDNNYVNDKRSNYYFNSLTFFILSLLFMLIYMVF